MQLQSYEEDPLFPWPSANAYAQLGHTTNLVGPKHQTVGGCWIATTAEQARTLLHVVKRDSVDQIFGFDFETVGWSPRDKRPPRHRAEAVTWSLAWNDGTLGKHPYKKKVPLCQRAFLLWTPEIVDVFREFFATEKIVAHNGPGFEDAVARNENVDLNIWVDSATWSKQSNNVPKLSHGLKRIMAEELGYVAREMKELFSRPGAGAMKVREKLGKSKRKVSYQDNPVPTILGLESQNVCWGRTEMYDLREIVPGHSRFIDLVDYGSLDSKACLEHYYMKLPVLKALKLDRYYHGVWFPQQIVLTYMENEGWPFDAEVCRQGVEELRTKAHELEVFLKGWGVCWTEEEVPGEIVEDPETGEFVQQNDVQCIPEVPNPNSDPVMSHILYGRGTYESKAGVCALGLGLKVPAVCGNPRAVQKTKRGKRPKDEMALLTLAMDPETPENHRPYLKAMVEYRKTLNMIGKLQRFPEAAQEEPDGRLRYQLKCMTDTGRLSASNQPIQQVPGGGLLREAFVAAPGHKLVVADYSGLEMRILAHFLEAWFSDTSLKDDVLSADVHSSTAKRVWPELLTNTPGDLRELKGTDREHLVELRASAKIINYAINYGKGAQGLGVQIRDPHTGEMVGTEAAQKLLDGYLKNAYPVIGQWRDELLEDAIAAGGVVRTLHGRCRLLPGLLLDPDNRREKWEYLADFRRMLNTPIQGSAADLVIMAMLKCNPYPDRRLKKLGWFNELLFNLGVKMLAQVHDELVFMVPEENADEARDEIKRAMENAVTLNICTPVDIHIVDNWGQAK